MPFARIEPSGKVRVMNVATRDTLRKSDVSKVPDPVNVMLAILPATLTANADAFPPGIGLPLESKVIMSQRNTLALIVAAVGDNVPEPRSAVSAKAATHKRQS